MLTYGFYNSYEHDRVYDAEQFAMMFDGLIHDGVYAHIGFKFEVVENPDAPNSVIVRSGRAYFNHTWTYNDSNLVVEMDPPEVYLQRYDAIVLDIQYTNDVRENKIISIKGTPTASSSSDNVPKPAMIDDTGHHQIPLAFVYRPSTNTPESQMVSQSWISYVVGTSGVCPYVTGILESFPVNEHYARWAQEWEDFKDQYESDYNAWVVRAEERYNADTTRLEAAWTSWVTSQETSFTAWRSGQESDFNTWKTQQRAAFTTWMNAQEADFNAWFANLQYVLDGDVAGHLQNEIDEINRVTLNPLPTSKGGTGNASGYIQTGFNSTYDGVEYPIGNNATSEGQITRAFGDYAHAEGFATKAFGYYSHAEGGWTTANGNNVTGGIYGACNHAEGNRSMSAGNASHAEGSSTEALGDGSHSEGCDTHAEGDYSHAEGENSYAKGNNSHVQNGGSNYKSTTQVQNQFDSERIADDPPIQKYMIFQAGGDSTSWYAFEIRVTIDGTTRTYYYDPYWYIDEDNYSSERDSFGWRHFYGYITRELITSDGETYFRSYVNYRNGRAYEDDPVHVEIDLIYSFGQVEAEGAASHAEGYGTLAKGIISHVEGEETSTTSDARASHVEGFRNLASGPYSHVEGATCIVSGRCSHAEGNHCVVEADYAHAEGFGSRAKGKYSHAGGNGGVTYREGQFAHGVFGFGGNTEDAYGNVATKFENAGTGVNIKIRSTQDSLGSGAARLVLYKGTGTPSHFWLLAMANSAGAAKLFMVNVYSATNPAIVTQISSVGNSLPNVLAEAITNDEITLFINNTTQYTVELQLMRMF